jgi:hypothetical protein
MSRSQQWILISYLVMLWLLFLVGIAAFVVTVVHGLAADTAPEAVATAVFGGVAAVAFVTVSLSQPLRVSRHLAERASSRPRAATPPLWQPPTGPPPSPRVDVDQLRSR